MWLINLQKTGILNVWHVSRVDSIVGLVEQTLSCIYKLIVKTYKMYQMHLSVLLKMSEQFIENKLKSFARRECEYEFHIEPIEFQMFMWYSLLHNSMHILNIL